MSHRSAPVEVRERVAFPPCAGRGFLRRLKDEGVAAEAVLLSTCNRTEVYAVVEDEGARELVLDLLAEDRSVERALLERDTYWMTDAEAVHHLYRVASSLDSMIVGEGQILGQVREAYRTATEEHCAGQILNRLFHSSLRIGKRVRSETGIGDSSLSVPRVAVELAREVFGSLAGRRALVLGAGDMSELVVKHLKDRGVSDLLITNRTPERARLLSDRVGGRDVAFEALADELPGIDIAVPRDIDPVVQTIENVYLYDIDDLQAVVERNAEGRQEAAEEGEAMISPAVLEFTGWLSTLHVVPLIQELRDGAEQIRRHELARALRKMDLSPEEQADVERMSHSLVNKLLHGPIQEIKARAEAGSPLESSEVRRRLMALDGLDVELHRPRRESS